MLLHDVLEVLPLGGGREAYADAVLEQRVVGRHVHAVLVDPLPEFLVAAHGPVGDGKLINIDVNRRGMLLAEIFGTVAYGSRDFGAGAGSPIFGLGSPVLLARTGCVAAVLAAFS
jgi:hypothetical protein